MRAHTPMNTQHAPYIPLDAVHVIIDWETFALQADAQIRSLGVALLHPLIGSIAWKNWNVQVADDLNYYRWQDTATQTWWKEQEAADATLAELMAKDQLPLQDVLEEFVELCTELDKLPYYLWGFGADFDLAILQHALRDSYLQMPANYSYRNNRCLRTLVAMYPSVEYPAHTGYKHFAGDDAIHEAKRLHAIMRVIGDNVRVLKPADMLTVQEIEQL